MVETITPVVHGGRVRWAGAVALHVAGATLAATLFGALLGAVGQALGAPFGRAGAVAVAVIALIFAVGLFPDVHVPVPQLRRQVPSWWRTFFTPPLTAFLYGAGLGVGFLTYLSTGVLVAVAAAAVATGDPRVGALVMAPFGIARGFSAVVALNVRSADDGMRLVDRLSRRPEALRLAVSAAALTAVAGFALVDASRSTGGWASLCLAVVAGIFGGAAISKIGLRPLWLQALAAHSLPAAAERAAGWAVPAVEALVPALAMLGYRTAAAGWASVLAVAFSAEVVRVRLRHGAMIPCGCFGGRREVRAWRLLARNGGVVAASAVAIAAGLDAPVVRWPGVPSTTELLPATIAVSGVIVMGIAAWQAHRSFGRGRT